MEVGYLVVREEMLCSSHTLHLALESIRMTLLLEHLTKNGDAILSIGQWAPQKIVDDFPARNYTICNLCILATVGQIAPREHVTFCIIV